MDILSNTLILVISSITLLFSLFLFSKAAGTISPLKLNTVSYALYFQIITSGFVGSVLVATNSVDYHYMIALVENKIKIFAWLGVLYSMLMMPLSMIYLNNLFKIQPIRDFHAYIEKPVEINYGALLNKVILMAMVIVSTIVLIYILLSNSSIPLFTLISGNEDLAAIQRVEVRREFGGIIYIKNLIGMLLIPIFSYYSVLKLIEKRSLFNYFAASILFFNACLLLTYDTQKAPIAFFFLGFLILYTLIYGGVSKKTFFKFSIGAILLIAVGYSLTGGRGLDQLLDYKSAFWGRTFVSSYGGYVLSLELFPEKITQPTWYIGIPSYFIDLLGWKNLESARLIMMYINPEGVEKGDANLVSSYYLGEAWANYGLIGLLVSPVIVGWVVQSLHIFLLKNPKDPLIISFYSYLSVKWLLSAGFVNFLFLKIILYPFIMFLLIKWFIKILPKKQPIYEKN